MADDPSLLANRGWRDAIRAHRVRTGAAVAAIALVLVAVIAPLREVAALAASKVILVVASPFAPSTKGLDTAPQPSRVVAADGTTVLGTLEDGDRRPVKLADLPPQVKDAVLAAEDADFYRHSGVNPAAVVRAAANMATGSGTQGGSTITQQLAKLNYTSGERTVFRKLKEVLFASRLERDYTKDQLLERYLNQIYLGDGAYGIEAGAERTFGVHAAQLSAPQAAALATRIRGSGVYDPRKRPQLVTDRRNRVLAIMASHGWVPKEQLAALQAEPLQVGPPVPPVAKPDRSVTDLATKEALALDLFGLSGDDEVTKLEASGLVLETLIDPKGQAAAHAAPAALLNAPDDPSAAIVGVVPGDGAITTLVGDSKGGAYSVATQGKRQPGSSFKPFTYLAGLESGVDPRTTFSSKSPQTFTYSGSTFEVSNNEQGNGGPITVDDAMAESVNVVYTQLVLKVGPKKAAEVAKRLGEGDQAALPSIALGGLREGVTGLQQAAAYATFASGGTYATPYLVRRIRDAQGHVIWEHQKQTRRALDPKEAGVLNAALMGVVQKGTGTAADLGRPTAGKTGTTQGSGDAWFVGFTPQVATAVWVGHVEGPTPMKDHRGRPVFGGGWPAQIFNKVMTAELAGQKPLPIPTATPDQLGLSSTVPTSATAGTAPAPTTTAPVDTTPTLAPPATVPSETTTTSSATTLAPLPGGGRSTTTTTTSPGATTTVTAATTKRAPTPTPSTTAPPP